MRGHQFIILLFVLSHYLIRTKSCKNFTVSEAYEILITSEDLIMIDIRSPEDFLASPVQAANIFFSTKSNITEFITEVQSLVPDRDSTLLISGYGDDSEFQVVDYLCSDGFSHTSAVLGGFDLLTAYNLSLSPSKCAHQIEVTDYELFNWGNETAFIDIRLSSDYATGHPSGFVNIPALVNVNGSVQLRSQGFLADVFHANKALPLVLIGGSEALTSTATKWLCDAHYTNITVLGGAFTGWQIGGLPVTLGAECLATRAAEQAFGFIR